MGWPRRREQRRSRFAGRLCKLVDLHARLCARLRVAVEGTHTLKRSQRISSMCPSRTSWEEVLVEAFQLEPPNREVFPVPQIMDDIVEATQPVPLERSQGQLLEQIAAITVPQIKDEIEEVIRLPPQNVVPVLQIKGKENIAEVFQLVAMCHRSCRKSRRWSSLRTKRAFKIGIVDAVVAGTPVPEGKMRRRRRRKGQLADYPGKCLQSIEQALDKHLTLL